MMTAVPAIQKPETGEKRAIGIDTIGMSMRFDRLLALDDVSVRVQAGTLHALLGENGAGKSTLVKCIMGFYQATSGQLIVDNKQAAMYGPKAALALGLGMVYQHFTLVPSLTGYENLLISRSNVTAVVNWKDVCAEIDAFMQKMPFELPLFRQVQDLSAGEKQKLEIIKQLYLGCRFLILDEPTSVLTPLEADEVLSHVRQLCEIGDITVLMITHKFREVLAYADCVSVLRSGRLVGEGSVQDLNPRDLATMMVGGDVDKTSIAADGAYASSGAQGKDSSHSTGHIVQDRVSSFSTGHNVQGRVSRKSAEPVLAISKLRVRGRFNEDSIAINDLRVQAGEIVGIAGVSGNGQTELMEVLCGQRKLQSGSIRVKGMPYSGTREQCNANHIRFLPEEPLRNGCAPRMSVSDNMAFRIFDQSQNNRRRFWLSRSNQRRHAQQLVEAFKVKTESLYAPVQTLSGGNVQRTVLARELSGRVDLLVISNPCFGLDFSAVSEIRQRILQAKATGTAVLLFSEDLDEILELADRVCVISAGHIVYNAAAETTDLSAVGRAMGGH